MINPLLFVPDAAATAGSLAGRVVAQLIPNHAFSDSLARRATADAAPQSSSGTSRSLGSTVAETTLRGQHVQLSALRQLVDRLSQQLGQTLTARLVQQGVDLSEPIALEIGPNGHVLETSGHFDRDKIENILQSDPDLARQLRSLLQMAKTLQQSAPNEESFGDDSLPVAVLERGQLTIHYN